jgi:hypothetical protein
MVNRYLVCILVFCGSCATPSISLDGRTARNAPKAGWWVEIDGLGLLRIVRTRDDLFQCELQAYGLDEAFYSGPCAATISTRDAIQGERICIEPARLSGQLTEREIKISGCLSLVRSDLPHRDSSVQEVR